jgi:hypothetical protein
MKKSFSPIKRLIIISGGLLISSFILGGLASTYDKLTPTQNINTQNTSAEVLSANTERKLTESLEQIPTQTIASTPVSTLTLSEIPSLTPSPTLVATKAPLKSPSPTAIVTKTPVSVPTKLCPAFKTCGKIASCTEAYAQLVCGNSDLDRDKDGIPCESICL